MLLLVGLLTSDFLLLTSDVFAFAAAKPPAQWHDKYEWNREIAIEIELGLKIDSL